MFRTTVLCILFVAVILVLQRETVTQESPECPVNSNYCPCGELCAPTCTNPHPDVRTCPRIPCRPPIRPGCRCLNGYVRDDNSQCIELSHCPSPEA